MIITLRVQTFFCNLLLLILKDHVALAHTDGAQRLPAAEGLPPETFEGQVDLNSFVPEKSSLSTVLPFSSTQKEDSLQLLSVLKNQDFLDTLLSRLVFPLIKREDEAVLSGGVQNAVQNYRITGLQRDLLLEALLEKALSPGRLLRENEAESESGDIKQHSEAGTVGFLKAGREPGIRTLQDVSAARDAIQDFMEMFHRLTAGSFDLASAGRAIQNLPPKFCLQLGTLLLEAGDAILEAVQDADHPASALVQQIIVPVVGDGVPYVDEKKIRAVYGVSPDADTYSYFHRAPAPGLADVLLEALTGRKALRSDVSTRESIGARSRIVNSAAELGKPHQSGDLYANLAGSFVDEFLIPAGVTTEVANLIEASPRFRPGKVDVGAKVAANDIIQLAFDLGEIVNSSGFHAAIADAFSTLFLKPLGLAPPVAALLHSKKPALLNSFAIKALLLQEAVVNNDKLALAILAPKALGALRLQNNTFKGAPAQLHGEDIPDGYPSGAAQQIRNETERLVERQAGYDSDSSGPGPSGTAEHVKNLAPTQQVQPPPLSTGARSTNVESLEKKTFKLRRPSAGTSPAEDVPKGISLLSKLVYPLRASAEVLQANNSEGEKKIDVLETREESVAHSMTPEEKSQVEVLFRLAAGGETFADADEMSSLTEKLDARSEIQAVVQEMGSLYGGSEEQKELAAAFVDHFLVPSGTVSEVASMIRKARNDMGVDGYEKVIVPEPVDYGMPDLHSFLPLAMELESLVGGKVAAALMADAFFKLVLIPLKLAAPVANLLIQNKPRLLTAFAVAALVALAPGRDELKRLLLLAVLAPAALKLLHPRDSGGMLSPLKLLLPILGGLKLLAIGGRFADILSPLAILLPLLAGAALLSSGSGGAGGAGGIGGLLSLGSHLLPLLALGLLKSGGKAGLLALGSSLIPLLGGKLAAEDLGVKALYLLLSGLGSGDMGEMTQPPMMGKTWDYKYYSEGASESPVAVVADSLTPEEDSELDVLFRSVAGGETFADADEGSSLTEKMDARSEIQAVVQEMGTLFGESEEQKELAAAFVDHFLVPSGTVSEVASMIRKARNDMGVDGYEKVIVPEPVDYGMPGLHSFLPLAMELESLVGGKVAAALMADAFFKLVLIPLKLAAPVANLLIQNKPRLLTAFAVAALVALAPGRDELKRLLLLAVLAPAALKLLHPRDSGGMLSPLKLLLPILGGLKLLAIGGRFADILSPLAILLPLLAGAALLSSGSGGAGGAGSIGGLLSLGSHLLPLLALGLLKSGGKAGLLTLGSSLIPLLGGKLAAEDLGVKALYLLLSGLGSGDMGEMTQPPMMGKTWDYKYYSEGASESPVAVVADSLTPEEDSELNVLFRSVAGGETFADADEGSSLTEKMDARSEIQAVVQEMGTLFGESEEQKELAAAFVDHFLVPSGTVSEVASMIRKARNDMGVDGYEKVIVPEPVDYGMPGLHSFLPLAMELESLVGGKVAAALMADAFFKLVLIPLKLAAPVANLLIQNKPRLLTAFAVAALVALAPGRDELKRLLLLAVLAPAALKLLHPRDSGGMLSPLKLLLPILGGLKLLAIGGRFADILSPLAILLPLLAGAALLSSGSGGAGGAGGIGGLLSLGSHLLPLLALGLLKSGGKAGLLALGSSLIPLLGGKLAAEDLGVKALYLLLSGLGSGDMGEMTQPPMMGKTWDYKYYSEGASESPVAVVADSLTPEEDSELDVLFRSVAGGETFADADEGSSLTEKLDARSEIQAVVQEMGSLYGGSEEQKELAAAFVDHFLVPSGTVSEVASMIRKARNDMGVDGYEKVIVPEPVDYGMPGLHSFLPLAMELESLVGGKVAAALMADAFFKLVLIPLKLAAPVANLLIQNKPRLLTAFAVAALVALAPGRDELKRLLLLAVLAPAALKLLHPRDSGGMLSPLKLLLPILGGLKLLAIGGRLADILAPLAILLPLLAGAALLSSGSDGAGGAGGIGGLLSLGSHLLPLLALGLLKSGGKAGLLALGSSLIPLLGGKLAAEDLGVKALYLLLSGLGSGDMGEMTQPPMMGKTWDYKYYSEGASESPVAVVADSLTPEEDSELDVLFRSVAGGETFADADEGSSLTEKMDARSEIQAVVQEMGSLYGGSEEQKELAAAFVDHFLVPSGTVSEVASMIRKARNDMGVDGYEKVIVPEPVDYGMPGLHSFLPLAMELESLVGGKVAAALMADAFFKLVLIPLKLAAPVANLLIQNKPRLLTAFAVAALVALAPGRDELKRLLLLAVLAPAALKLLHPRDSGGMLSPLKLLLPILGGLKLLAIGGRFADILSPLAILLPLLAGAALLSSGSGGAGGAGGIGGLLSLGSHLLPLLALGLLKSGGKAGLLALGSSLIPLLGGKLAAEDLGVKALYLFLSGLGSGDMGEMTQPPMMGKTWDYKYYSEGASESPVAVVADSLTPEEDSELDVLFRSVAGGETFADADEGSSLTEKLDARSEIQAVVQEMGTLFGESEEQKELAAAFVDHFLVPSGTVSEVASMIRKARNDMGVDGYEKVIVPEPVDYGMPGLHSFLPLAMELESLVGGKVAAALMADAFFKLVLIPLKLAAPVANLLIQNKPRLLTAFAVAALVALAPGRDELKRLLLLAVLAPAALKLLHPRDSGGMLSPLKLLLPILGGLKLLAIGGRFADILSPLAILLPLLAGAALLSSGSGGAGGAGGIGGLLSLGSHLLPLLALGLLKSGGKAGLLALGSSLIPLLGGKLAAEDLGVKALYLLLSGLGSGDMGEMTQPPMMGKTWDYKYYSEGASESPVAVVADSLTPEEDSELDVLFRSVAGGETFADADEGSSLTEKMDARSEIQAVVQEMGTLFGESDDQKELAAAFVDHFLVPSGTVSEVASMIRKARNDMGVDGYEKVIVPEPVDYGMPGLHSFLPLAMELESLVGGKVAAALMADAFFKLVLIPLKLAAPVANLLIQNKPRLLTAFAVAALVALAPGRDELKRLLLLAVLAPAALKLLHPRDSGGMLSPLKLLLPILGGLKLLAIGGRFADILSPLAILLPLLAGAALLSSGSGGAGGAGGIGGLLSLGSHLLPLLALGLLKSGGKAGLLALGSSLIPLLGGKLAAEDLGVKALYLLLSGLGSGDMGEMTQPPMMGKTWDYKYYSEGASESPVAVVADSLTPEEDSELDVLFRSVAGGETFADADEGSSLTEKMDARSEIQAVVQEMGTLFGESDDQKELAAAFVDHFLVPSGTVSEVASMIRKARNDMGVDGYEKVIVPVPVDYGMPGLHSFLPLAMELESLVGGKVAAALMADAFFKLVLIPLKLAAPVANLLIQNKPRLLTAFAVAALVALAPGRDELKRLLLLAVLAPAALKLLHPRDSGGMLSPLKLLLPILGGLKLLAIGGRFADILSPLAILLPLLAGAALLSSGSGGAGGAGGIGGLLSLGSHLLPLLALGLLKSGGKAGLLALGSSLIPLLGGKLAAEDLGVKALYLLLSGLGSGDMGEMTQPPMMGKTWDYKYYSEGASESPVAVVADSLTPEEDSELNVLFRSVAGGETFADADEGSSLTEKMDARSEIQAVVQEMGTLFGESEEQKELAAAFVDHFLVPSGTVSEVASMIRKARNDMGVDGYEKVIVPVPVDYGMPGLHSFLPLAMELESLVGGKVAAALMADAFFKLVLIPLKLAAPVANLLIQNKPRLLTAFAVAALVALAPGRDELKRLLLLAVLAPAALKLLHPRDSGGMLSPLKLLLPILGGLKLLAIGGRFADILSPLAILLPLLAGAALLSSGSGGAGGAGGIGGLLSLGSHLLPLLALGLLKSGGKAGLLALGSSLIPLLGGKLAAEDLGVKALYLLLSGLGSGDMGEMTQPPMMGKTWDYKYYSEGASESPVAVVADSLTPEEDSELNVLFRSVAGGETFADADEGSSLTEKMDARSEIQAVVQEMGSLYGGSEEQKELAAAFVDHFLVPSGTVSEVASMIRKARNDMGVDGYEKVIVPEPVDYGMPGLHSFLPLAMELESLVGGKVAAALMADAFFKLVLIPLKLAAPVANLLIQNKPRLLTAFAVAALVALAPGRDELKRLLLLAVLAPAALKLLHPRDSGGLLSPLTLLVPIIGSLNVLAFGGLLGSVLSPLALLLPFVAPTAVLASSIHGAGGGLIPLCFLLALLAPALRTVVEGGALDAPFDLLSPLVGDGAGGGVFPLLSLLSVLMPGLLTSGEGGALSALFDLLSPLLGGQFNDEDLGAKILVLLISTLFGGLESLAQAPL